VDIQFIGTDELRDKLIAAVHESKVPDVTFSMWVDVLLGPKWA